MNLQSASHAVALSVALSVVLVVGSFLPTHVSAQAASTDAKVKAAAAARAAEAANAAIESAKRASAAAEQARVNAEAAMADARAKADEANKAAAAEAAVEAATEPAARAATEAAAGTAAEAAAGTSTANTTKAAKAAADSKADDSPAIADPKPFSLKRNAPWVSSLGLGAQFLPNYNEEGESQGLKEQRLFADLSVDGRFTPTLRGGVKILSLGTPVVRQDGEKPKTLPAEFDDVAQTLVGSAYFYWTPWHMADWASVEEDDSKDVKEKKQTKKKRTLEEVKKANASSVHNLGPLVRAGVISRDTLGTNADSVSWFGQLGLQYTYERYHLPDAESETGYWNGLPDGFISLSYARYEDYAQTGRRSRFVVDSGFKVPNTTRLYAGFRGNFGKGADDMGLYLAYYFAPDRLLNFFGSSDE